MTEDRIRRRTFLLALGMVAAWASGARAAVNYRLVQVVGGVDVPLAGQVLKGTITVAIRPKTGIRSVAFALDGVTKRTDAAQPFNWTPDTTTWAEGAHTIRATITTTKGGTVIRSASVTVDNVPTGGGGTTYGATTYGATTYGG